MTTTTAPQVGKAQWAQTTTPAAQHCVVQVTAIDEETETGWLVYGYRVYARRRNGIRSTSYPQLYFIAKEV